VTTTSPTWAAGSEFSAVIVDHLTRSQIVQYAGASGDFNPIHTDEVYATAVAGLPTTFGHGMLTMGACGAFVQGLVGPPALRSYAARFVEKVWPGDTLTASAVVTSADPGESGTAVELELTVTNQDGVVVLRGVAVADVPADSSPATSDPSRSEHLSA
jgi:acyl dehydratase